MRLVIQRVSQGALRVNGEDVGRINKGLVVYVGFSEKDGNRSDLNVVFKKVVDKLIGLRIFPDENGKMNLSIKDINGGIIFVSNFTLYANIAKGKRPSFTAALSPKVAEPLYKKLESMMEMGMENEGLTFLHGTFGAFMEIDAISWGPVNIVWDV